MRATRLPSNYKIMEFVMGVRITDTPSRQAHDFVANPNRVDKKKDFSALVSNAGDWTSKAIRNSLGQL